MYGYKCEYCDGTVEKHIVEKEAFKHKKGFVILENVPVGICNKCGNRYYNAAVLKKVQEIAEKPRCAQRTESIPVGHMESEDNF